MKNKKKIIILCCIVFLAFLIFIFDRSAYREYSKNYFYMDTYINVKINTNKSRKNIENIFNDIDYIYSDYHKLTDRFNEYSDVINVYYLNEVLSNGEKIKIDGRLSDIIKLGISYYDKTDGLFNIASGNLTYIWKGFIDRCDSLLLESDLDVNININDITLSDNIYTKNNNIKLDLGGIAKGYVTELVGDYLEECGIDNYIINAGGNVKVGNVYKKDNYVVGITDPDNTSSIFTKLNVNDLSIVTSGNYQRYCEMDGKIYGHIINPLTKKPANYFKSVTIVGNDSALSDIYSTYLYLLPVERGLEVINSVSGLEAIWYIDKDNIVRSDGFKYE